MHNNSSFLENCSDARYCCCLRMSVSVTCCLFSRIENSFWMFGRTPLRVWGWSWTQDRCRYVAVLFGRHERVFRRQLDDARFPWYAWQGCLWIYSRFGFLCFLITLRAVPFYVRVTASARSVTDLSPHWRTDPGSQRPVFPDSHPSKYTNQGRRTLTSVNEQQS